jgi:hypothetical protein
MKNDDSKFIKKAELGDVISDLNNVEILYLESFLNLSSNVCRDSNSLLDPSAIRVD